jgi:hypothetical protein
MNRTGAEGAQKGGVAGVKSFWAMRSKAHRSRSTLGLLGFAHRKRPEGTVGSLHYKLIIL